MPTKPQAHPPNLAPTDIRVLVTALSLAVAATAPLGAVSPGFIDTNLTDGTHAGWVQVEYPMSSDLATDVAVDAQGRILVASLDQEVGFGPFARLRRFFADGAPDTSFAATGVYTMQVTPESFAVVAVAVAGDDIYLGTSVDVAALPDADFYLERVSAAGTLLASRVIDFNHGGGSRDYLADLATGNGRVVAVGQAEFANNADYDWAVAVMVPSTLSLDTTFSTDGKAFVAFDLGGDDYDEATRVALDGTRIVIGGFAIGSANRFGAIARFDAVGNLDPGFGVGGRASYAFTPSIGTSSTFNEVRDLLVDAGGGIWAAATVRDPRFVDPTRDAALVRILANGIEDAAWGITGWSLVDFPFPLAGSANDEARGLARDRDGRFLLAARNITTSGSGAEIAGVARLSAAGDLDPTFGATGNGRAQYVLSGVVDTRVAGATLDASDRLLLCGRYSESGGSLDPFVARVVGNVVLSDGFESGTTVMWSAVAP